MYVVFTSSRPEIASTVDRNCSWVEGWLVKLRLGFRKRAVVIGKLSKYYKNTNKRNSCQTVMYEFLSPDESPFAVSAGGQSNGLKTSN